MSERELSSGLIVPVTVETTEPPINSAVPANMCYVAGQLCRGLALLARDPMSFIETGSMEMAEQEINLVTAARQDFLAVCGRNCVQRCRLPDVDTMLRSRLDIPLDISETDLALLTGILSFLDQDMQPEEVEARELRPVRGIVDNYVKMVCDSALVAGSKPFTTPSFTDGYCASFSRFSGPNYHVIKLVTHNLTTMSYAQQVNEKPETVGVRAGIELTDPLAVDEQDLRNYLLKLDADTSYVLNLKSTEHRDMFKA